MRPSGLSVVDDGILALVCLALDHRAEPTALLTFKNKVISMSEMSLETEGAFDFVVQMRFASILDFNAFLSSIADELRLLVANYETSFVCKRYVRDAQPEECLWVPCTEGRQRLDFKDIIKVKAERDYMRVHAREASWLLHTTITKLKRSLNGKGFLHVHRSTIVNQQHVHRILHHQRYWSLVLSDGSVEAVSKSHAAGTIHALAELGSSKDDALVENSENSHRMVHAI